MRAMVQFLVLVLLVPVLQGCYAYVGVGPVYRVNPYYVPPVCSWVTIGHYNYYGYYQGQTFITCRRPMANSVRSAEELAIDFQMSVPTAVKVIAINDRLVQGDKDVLVDMGISDSQIRAILSYLDGNAELALSEHTVDQVARYIDYDVVLTRRFLGDVLKVLRRDIQAYKARSST